jgi:hypothetical protein
MLVHPSARKAVKRVDPKRWEMIGAFERSQGRLPSRAERVWLLTTPASEIIETMQRRASFGAEPLTHVQAHGIILQAFANDRGRAPTAAEAEASQSVGHHETGYGRYWKPPGQDSHNWGAVQTRGPGFSYQDSSPDTGVYTVNFKVYPDDIAGAQDFIHFLHNDPMTALARGEGLVGFAKGMYGNHYFEGFNASPTQQEQWKDAIDALMALGMTDRVKAGRVAGYAVALDKSASEIAKALGVPRATKLLPGSANTDAGIAASFGGKVVGFAFAACLGYEILKRIT